MKTSPTARTCVPSTTTSGGVFRRRLRWLTVCWLVGCWPLASVYGAAPAADEAVEIETRLADTVRYLASDELEGRLLGSKGRDLAADYIAGQFKDIGLKTALFDGGPFQRFRVTNSAELGPDNRLALIGPPNADGGKPATFELKAGEDFTPLLAGGPGEFDLPLVFVGYGITAKAEGYDDYAGVDVAGKAVVVLRHEPQQADPKSVFNGTESSRYAPFVHKIANAAEHGAAAVVFCTDAFDVRKGIELRRVQWQQALDGLADELARFRQIETPTLRQIEAQQARIDELLREVQDAGSRLRAQRDPVLTSRAAGRDSQNDLPAIHCRREWLDRAVRAAMGASLAEIEEQIDEGLRPHSGPLTGWRVTGRTDVRREQVEGKNVVAVLEGEGPLAEETIVVGAHYDHLGLSRASRRTPDVRPVYNGADDNASGVAAVIEIARTLAYRPERLRRRVVFIAFDAEEEGLLGSAYYVNHPLVPLDKTAAVVNLDMVGRLRDDEVTAVASGTGTTFDPLLNQIDEHDDLILLRTPEGEGFSDHASFHAKGIPAVHLYTGMHDELHQFTDDFETLNVPGMRRVTRFVTELVVGLANADERPKFVAPE